MKRLLCIVMIVLLVGCAQPGIAEGIRAETLTSELGFGVTRIIDEEAGVVCYIYARGYAGGISCLPLSETGLK